MVTWLIALIESTPVREVCEGTRQEAGAVGPTVPCKHLIFGREVLISADVEGVDVGGGTPVHVVVVIKPALGWRRKQTE